MAEGISGGGRSAEERYRQLTGATKTTRSGDGDAVLGGSPVEVKKATSNTINQVRAVKYIPLVVYSEADDAWYVVPAHIVVALVAAKSRGQHTENPFESATLSVAKLSKYRVSRPQDLGTATIRAIEEAKAYAQLKGAMDRVLAESKALASRSVRDVQSLLATLGVRT